jgi:anti-sigma factor RsiW
MTEENGPKMKGDRELAGLWCHEVLAGLSDYLDGELPERLNPQVEDHLRQCDTCAGFGGRVSQVVGALKEKLAQPDPISDSLKERLMRDLKAEPNK